MSRRFRSRRHRSRGQKAHRDRLFEALLEPYRRAYLAVHAPSDLVARVRTRTSIRRSDPALDPESDVGPGRGNGSAGPARRSRLLAGLGLAASLLLAAGVGWLHARVERGAEGGHPRGAASGSAPPGSVREDAPAWPPFDDASAERRREALLESSSSLPCPPDAPVEAWRAALSDPDASVRRVARALLRMAGRLSPRDEGP